MMVVRILLLSVWTLLMISSCGTSQKALSSGNVRPSLTPEAQFEHDKLFYEALVQRNAKRFDAAYELLCQTLALDSTAPEVHYCLSDVLLETQSSRDTVMQQRALNHLKLAIKYAPETPHYLERYAELLLQKNRFEEALPYLERLAKLTPDPNVYYQLTKNYAYLQRYDDAHKAIDHILNLEGDLFFIIEEKARLYATAGDTAAVFALLHKKVQEHPDEVDYLTLLTDFYNHYNRSEDAERLLLSKLEKSPENVACQIALFNTYFSFMPQREKEQWEILERIALNDLIEEERRTKIIATVANHCLEKGISIAPIFNIYETVIQQPLLTSCMPYHYVYLLEKLQHPVEKILEVLEIALEAEPENIDARKNLFLLLYKQRDMEKLFEACEAARTYVPGYLWFYYFEAQLHLSEHSDYQRVVELLNQGLLLNADASDELLPDVYGMLGDSYHELGEKELAFEAYEKCIALDPYHALSLNNYAYFLSLEGKQLDRAEELALRVLEIEPNNPTYLDTYAWVLYLQEKYTQAKIYIDKTLKELGDDEAGNETLFDHAGDIYLKCDLRKEACMYWIKAFELTTDTEERRAIHKKIKRYASPPIKIPKL